MANRTIHSSTVTVVDFTDQRKLDVYLASNLPTTQIKISSGYTPNWAESPYLKLTASTFLDSQETTALSGSTTYVWKTKNGIGVEQIIEATSNRIISDNTLTIKTNEIPNNGVISYICEATYRVNLQDTGVTSRTEISFNQVVNGTNGQDGTSVNILGSYDTASALETAHPDNNHPGDAYIVGNRDLYVWSPENSAWVDVGDIQGPPGTPGADGRGIVSTEITYQASMSGVQQPTGTWHIAIPTVSENQFLWTRTVITYTDNTISTSYSVGKMGAQGVAGVSAPVVFLTNENISISADANGGIGVSNILRFSNVVAYIGATAVIPTIDTSIITGLPSGMTVTQATIDNQVQLTFSIEANSNLGSSGSNYGTISIPVTIPIDGSPSVSVVLVMNWNKVNTGNSGDRGSDAVTFKIHSNNGYVLSKNIQSTTLQTFAYIGSALITSGATYQWYELVGGNWQTISDATNAYYDVLHTNILNSKSYMCTMMFGGVEYSDVVTIEDKNDMNTVFTSKPTSYSVGDIWIVNADYTHPNFELGTMLKSEHTNDIYTDSDWVLATKYDGKVADVENKYYNLSQYFSFSKTEGLTMTAIDEDNNPSPFSATLSNSKLSFNQNSQEVAYISNNKLNITEAEIISPLSVTGKYSGNTMLQAPTINLGNFSLIVESNGSLSIVANL